MIVVPDDNVITMKYYHYNDQFLLKEKTIPQSLTQEKNKKWIFQELYVFNLFGNVINARWAITSV